MTTGVDPSVSWLVTAFAEGVAGVSHAVLVAADGTLVAASPGLLDERAEQLAAVATGLGRLTLGASGTFRGGRVVHATVETDNWYLLLMGTSSGAQLATLADSHCDIGLVGYEMTLLVEQVSNMVDTPLRGAGH